MKVVRSSAFLRGMSAIIVMMLVTTILAAMGLDRVTPVANAAEGKQLSNEEYITKFEFVDKDNNPWTGDLTTDNIARKDLGIVVEGYFPDDAKQGDYIQFMSSLPMQFNTYQINLEATDTEGNTVPMARLDIERPDRNASNIEQKFVVQMLEDADKYVDRKFSIRLAISNVELPCTEGDVLSRPLEFFVTDSQRDKWFLSTGVNVTGRKCASATNPSPRGWEEGVPITQMVCKIPDFYVTDSIVPQKTLYNGITVNNILRLNETVDMYISAGQFEMFNDMVFRYDANRNIADDPALEDKKIRFAESESTASALLSMSSNAIIVESVPVMFEEFDAVEGGLEPGTGSLSDAFKDPETGADVAVVAERGGAHIPHNFLFPDKESANWFKYSVTARYGEDVWDNTNDAFAKLSDADADVIFEEAKSVWRTFFSERVAIERYLPDEGQVEFTFKDVPGLANLVTADTDMPLEGDRALVRGLQGVKVTMDAGVFYPYAFYRGAQSYPAPHFSYATDTGLYSGECTTSSNHAIGTVSGVAWGTIPDFSLGSVRWDKMFITPEREEPFRLRNMGSSFDSLFKSIVWKIEKIDDPSWEPLLVNDAISKNDIGIDTDPKRGSYRVYGLPPGKYQLSEESVPEGMSKIDPIEFDVSRDSVASQHVELGSAVNKVENSYAAWKKVRIDGEPLGGTKWQVTDGNQKVIIEDCVSGDCGGDPVDVFYKDIDPRPGFFKVKVRGLGERHFTEVYAPEPFILAKNSEYGPLVDAFGRVFDEGAPVVNEVPTRVCLRKVDAVTGNFLQDAEVRAFAKQDRYSLFLPLTGNQGEDWEKKFTSDSEGMFGCMEFDIPDDETSVYADLFHVSETKSPRGYAKDEHIYEVGIQKNDSDEERYGVTVFSGGRKEWDYSTHWDGLTRVITIDMPNEPLPPVDVPFTLPATGDKPVLIGLLMGGAVALLASLHRLQVVRSRKKSAK